MKMARILKLGNGVSMPALGFGTWLAEAGLVGESVKAALRIGYRHIDCASRYANEAEIGAAVTSSINKGDVKRSDVFLTGKVWPQDYTRVREACERSIKDLQVDYLDQYLTHFPVEIDVNCKTFFPENGVGLVGYHPDRFQEIWGELERLYNAGLVRSIGVCNFTHHKLSELIKRSPEIKPHTIQNEYHPHLPQWKLFDYCKKENISMTAFSSLGNRERPPAMIEDGDTVILEDPMITSIANKHNCSNAQVLLSWGMQRGTAVLTRSLHQHEMQNSYDSVNVTLDEQDMEKIKGITTRCRYLRAKWIRRPDQTLEEAWDNELLG